MIDERGIRIEDKLDKISERLNSIDITLTSQHESLKDHMRRTELLEIRIDPIEKVIYKRAGSIATGGYIASVIGLIAAIVEIIHYFKG